MQSVEKRIWSMITPVFAPGSTVIGVVTVFALFSLFTQSVEAQEIKKDPFIHEPHHFGSEGVLRCSLLQLLSPNGEPINAKVVTLKKEHYRWTRPHVSAISVYYRPIRKMKTNDRGEIQLPGLAKEGIYQLSFEIQGKPAFGLFEVGKNWTGESCTESLMVEDHQEHLQLSAKVTSNAAEK
ncbi:MAG TPA: hypothetical protein VHA33_16360 [Candidatus Angelobacter sp.]|jgi:hypothetical protein|nr:hypothetical protein [Candidatus Angelobacter sp.]